MKPEDSAALRRRISEIPKEKFSMAISDLKRRRLVLSKPYATHCVVDAGGHFPLLGVVALAAVKCYFPDITWDVSALDLVESKADADGALRAAGLEVVPCDCCRA